MAVVLDTSDNLVRRLVDLILEDIWLFLILALIILSSIFAWNWVERFRLTFILKMISWITHLSSIFTVVNNPSSIGLLRIHNSNDILNVVTSPISHVSSRPYDLIHRLSKEIIFIDICHFHVVLTIVPDDFWSLLLSKRPWLAIFLS